MEINEISIIPPKTINGLDIIKKLVSNSSLKNILTNILNKTNQNIFSTIYDQETSNINLDKKLISTIQYIISNNIRLPEKYDNHSIIPSISSSGFADNLYDIQNLITKKEYFLKQGNLKSKQKLNRYDSLLNMPPTESSILYNIDGKEYIYYSPEYKTEGLISFVLSLLSYEENNQLSGFTKNYLYIHDEHEKQIFILNEKLKPLSVLFNDDIIFNNISITNSTKLLYFIFNLCYTLYNSFNLLKFRHNDLHIGNMMIRINNESENKKIIIDNTNFIVFPKELTRYEIVLIDYGMSSITIPFNNKNINIVTRPKLQWQQLIKLEDSNINFDIIYLISKIMSNYNEYIINLFKMSQDEFFAEIQNIGLMYIPMNNILNNIEGLPTDLLLTTLIRISINRNFIEMESVIKSYPIKTFSRIINTPFEKIGKMKVRPADYYGDIIFSKIKSVALVILNPKFEIPNYQITTNTHLSRYNNKIYCIFINSKKAYKENFKFKTSCCAIDIMNYSKTKKGVIINASFFDIHGDYENKLNSNNDPSYKPFGIYKSQTGETGIEYKNTNINKYKSFNNNDGYIVIDKKNNKLSIMDEKDYIRNGVGTTDQILQVGPLLIYNNKHLLTKHDITNTGYYYKTDTKNMIPRYTCYTTEINKKNFLNKYEQDGNDYKIELNNCNQSNPGEYYHAGNPNPRTILCISNKILKYTYKDKIIKWDTLFMVCRGREIMNNLGLDLIQIQDFIENDIIQKSIDYKNIDINNEYSVINLDGGGSSNFAINEGGNMDIILGPLGNIDNRLVGSVLELTQ
jgi:hypothetical protein